MPEPNVLLEISPLVLIDRIPAWTVTAPALPELSASPTIAPEFAIMARAAVTEMLPPLPGPKFLTEMMPPFVTDNDPAPTVTVPAAPLFAALASEKIPPELSIVSAPGTLTMTLPPLPVPKVLPEISPLVCMVKVPAPTATFPAFPVLPCSASEAMPVTPPLDVPVIVS